MQSILMNKEYGLLIKKNMEEVYVGLDISQTETLKYIYHMARAAWCDFGFLFSDLRGLSKFSTLPCYLKGSE